MPNAICQTKNKIVYRNHSLNQSIIHSRSIYCTIIRVICQLCMMPMMVWCMLTPRLPRTVFTSNSTPGEEGLTNMFIYLLVLMEGQTVMDYSFVLSLTSFSPWVCVVIYFQIKCEWLSCNELHTYTNYIIFIKFCSSVYNILFSLFNKRKKKFLYNLKYFTFHFNYLYKENR